jgi:hypothetical protein
MTSKQVPPAERRKPPAAGKGRPKGSQNKTTTLLKDAILKAADQAGGKDGLVGYLRIQAAENPGPFMSLLGKVLPTQVEGPGPNGEHLIRKIEIEIVKAPTPGS